MWVDGGGNPATTLFNQTWGCLHLSFAPSFSLACPRLWLWLRRTPCRLFLYIHKYPLIAVPCLKTERPIVKRALHCCTPYNPHVLNIKQKAFAQKTALVRTFCVAGIEFVVVFVHCYALCFIDRDGLADWREWRFI